jgi:putative ABC transport system permease protein
MRAWGFALRSLLRQPARTVLGVLGVAAVGALLFDMLLLSRGLLVSFQELLGSAGFDVRVLATDLPFSSNVPPIEPASDAAAALRALPSILEVVPIRFGSASATGKDGRPLEVDFNGVDPGEHRPWRLLEGTDLAPPGAGAEPALVVNRNLARAAGLEPGGSLLLRPTCGRDGVAPPPARFLVAGVVEFPFDSPGALSAVARMADFRRACGVALDQADLLLVASRHGPEDAVRAIRQARPELHPFSNEELLARFQQVGFSYFRQISSVLSSVTLFFGFLLISVLLTVSVNQRLAEIAALRALGFTRRRVVLDVLLQSAMLVGTGGALSLPLGVLLSLWLDRILRAMPGIPAAVSFFAFEPRAVFLHVSLLALTALLAALYPMRLVARLPISATLRSEAVT